MYTHSLRGLILYCNFFFIDSFVVECNIPRCYVCLNTWNNYCVIFTRVGICDYVYVGVYAYIYNVCMYVCMCMFIYIDVYGSSPWNWRVLNFCKVALWHFLALGAGRFIYVCKSRRVIDYVHTNTWLYILIHGCACMCMGACMHTNKMLYYIMITKFTVTECNSHLFLLMYLLKETK